MKPISEVISSTFLDETPITEDWLISCGFKPVPSDIGPEYADHMEKEGLNIWEFNNTGEWLFNDYDRLGMRTRGRLRMLAFLLDIEMTNAEVSGAKTIYEANNGED